MLLSIMSGRQLKDAMECVHVIAAGRKSCSLWNNLLSPKLFCMTEIGPSTSDGNWPFYFRLWVALYARL